MIFLNVFDKLDTYQTQENLTYRLSLRGMCLSNSVLRVGNKVSLINKREKRRQNKGKVFAGIFWREFESSVDKKRSARGRNGGRYIWGKYFGFYFFMLFQQGISYEKVLMHKET